MTTTAETVWIDVGPVRIADVVAVARDLVPVALTGQAVAAMTTSRETISSLADDAEPHYGVSTGFGALANRHIPAERRAQLQRSLIRSHAATSGDLVEPEVVRAMMMLRLSTLATGRTGVEVATAQLYGEMLNAGLLPMVKEFGSLGCSGDLAPLAQCALAAMGEAELRVLDDHGVPGPARPARDALADAGLEPVMLTEKEGLALINGTDGMLGMLSIALTDLDRLIKVADVAAAMSIEALHGTARVFQPDLQELRPHPGQLASADNLVRLMADSAIVASHQGPDCTLVQDAYSLRCSPQVHGAARDTLNHARQVAEIELTSAIDNPVITLDGRVESNGNFHGAPLGYVLDFLAIAVADVASISERRSDRFLDVARSNGLPPFLADDPGVDSGHMIAQYTQAGLVNELKRLATPASVDSIPSSAMQEDHVSMGWNAARKLRRAISGLRQVLSIEILTAARGLDLRGLPPAPGTAAVRDALRAAGIPGPGPDRYLADEIDAAVTLAGSGAVLTAAEQAIGPLR